LIDFVHSLPLTSLSLLLLLSLFLTLSPLLSLSFINQYYFSVTVSKCLTLYMQKGKANKKFCWAQSVFIATKDHLFNKIISHCRLKVNLSSSYSLIYKELHYNRKEAWSAIQGAHQLSHNTLSLTLQLHFFLFYLTGASFFWLHFFHFRIFHKIR
jgi:hypothetical protein